MHLKPLQGGTPQQKRENLAFFDRTAFTGKTTLPTHWHNGEMVRDAEGAFVFRIGHI